MACFVDINVSQGSVATYARRGGFLDIHLTANLPGNLPVKNCFKSIKNWQNYGHESVAAFLAHPVDWDGRFGLEAGLVSSARLVLNTCGLANYRWLNLLLAPVYHRSFALREGPRGVDVGPPTRGLPIRTEASGVAVAWAKSWRVPEFQSKKCK